jgi:hypothetical protein
VKHSALFVNDLRVIGLLLEKICFPLSSRRKK